MGEDGSCPSCRKTFVLVIGLNVAATIAELIGVWFTGSLGVLVNVAMGLLDATALVLNYYGLTIEETNGKRKQKEDHAERIAHFSNMLLAGFCVGIVLFAIARLIYGTAEMSGVVIMFVAGLGLLCDGVSLGIYPDGNGHVARKHSPNLRSGRVKVLNGVLSCGASFLAGALILVTGWYVIDSLVSIAVGAFVLWLLHAEFREHKKRTN